VTTINLSLDDIAALLVCESTDRLNANNFVFGPHFEEGEVISMISPPPNRYTHPSVPLVTTQKLRFSVAAGSKNVHKREFFVVDKCEAIHDADGKRQAVVRTWASLDAKGEWCMYRHSYILDTHTRT
jgi:hypothetical protein